MRIGSPLRPGKPYAYAEDLGFYPYTAIWQPFIMELGNGMNIKEHGTLTKAASIQKYQKGVPFWF